jgi:voltage-gated potassium channel
MVLRRAAHTPHYEEPERLQAASVRGLGERRRANLRALEIAGAVFVSLVIIAVAFYRLVAHYSILDAIFMTVITISTVGYGEPSPLGPVGKIFTSFLIFSGLATITIAAWHAAELVVGQELLDFLGRRKRMRTIENLRDHYIICGYGRMGQEIVKQLEGHGVAMVVIERDPEPLARLQEAVVLFVAGNATDDDVLLAAGIQRAKGLVAVTSTDEDNLFLTVSARVLNPELHIVARCAAAASHDKFARAGASRVVSPYVTGGRQIAAALLRPVLVDFLDILLHVEERDVDMAQITVTEDAPFAGMSLAEAAVREQCAAGIIAVRGPDGRFHTNPSPDYVMQRGDVLIALGPAEQLSCLERLCGCGV